MKRKFLGIFFILTISVFGISAQSAARRSFEKGMDSANAGNFETALSDFKQSLALVEAESSDEKFSAKIHFNIGVCFYRLNQHAPAVAEFEKALNLTKGDYEKAFYSLGMAQAELKNWQAAEAAFAGAIRLNKTDGEAWFDLAFVYLAQNDYGSARNAFQKSIRYKSGASSIGHNNLGVIFALDGDFPAAVKEFKIALSETKGKLTAAESNLQFCKLRQKNRETIAKLEFTK